VFARAGCSPGIPGRSDRDPPSNANAFGQVHYICKHHTERDTDEIKKGYFRQYIQLASRQVLFPSISW
jgi:hypothetical protein